MTTRYLVSEKRALEIAAWTRIVSGVLKREANNAFWAGEIERASSFHHSLLIPSNKLRIVPSLERGEGKENPE